MARLFMMRAVIILCLLLTPALVARTRIIRPSIIETGHILFVAAHPDDEVVVAPLLGSLCAEGGSTCSFLVLTRGEAGTCALPTCPDLGAIREQEMRNSAAMFGASVTQLTYPDVLSDFDTRWGGANDAIAAAIRDENPDVVITFDPLHGTTCHPAHRAIGAMTIEAIGVDGPPLYLLATTAYLDSAAYRFQPGTTGAMVFDAAGWWQYAIDAASAHQSQFTPEQIEALRATPLSEKKVWLTRPDTPRVPLLPACGEKVARSAG